MSFHRTPHTIEPSPFFAQRLLSSSGALKQKSTRQRIINPQPDNASDSLWVSSPPPSRRSRHVTRDTGSNRQHRVSACTAVERRDRGHQSGVPASTKASSIFFVFAIPHTITTTAPFSEASKACFAGRIDDVLWPELRRFRRKTEHQPTITGAKKIF